MFALKVTPEAFIVNEVGEHQLVNAGPYGLFMLEKRCLNTSEAISMIMRRFRLNPKSLGFAGNKDKHAITFQFVSIKGGNEAHSFEAPSLRLQFLGFIKEPVRIGQLLGNQFLITVKTDQRLVCRATMPNYFGEQRFSKANTHIGLSLIKQDFCNAVGLIGASNPAFKEASAKHLIDYPNDYVGCLNKIDKHLLLLYVHSFQSLLWNRALDLKIRNSGEHTEHEVASTKLAFPLRPLKDFYLPLPGFAVKHSPEYAPLMEEYSISPESFVIRPIPWLSQEGADRPAFVPIQELEVVRTNLEEYKLNFFLQKGSYATIAVRALLE
jgi:tRNA(Glu) U13 pseudouridine synthase TruD